MSDSMGPMTTLQFSEGDWLQWTSPHHIKEGQVVQVAGPGIVVRWLGGDEQVFPVIEGYLPPYAGGEYRMELVPRPPRASRIERDRAHGVMSVQRAAAILGTTPKRVRAQLRDGSLRGERRDGKWVGVELN